MKESTANYHGGFNYIWNEIQILVTFESNWRKTREILEKIAKEKSNPRQSRLKHNCVKPLRDT